MAKVRNVIIHYKNKDFVSREILFDYFTDRNKVTNNILMFGTEILYEVHDVKTITHLQIANFDKAMKNFIDVPKEAQSWKIPLKECFFVDDLVLISVAKLSIPNKHANKFNLPLLKLFGKYYVVCNKCKDDNTLYAVVTK